MVIGKGARLFSTEVRELHEFQFKVNLRAFSQVRVPEMFQGN